MQLFPHQQQALTRTEGFNRCAFYYDMGLGKTFIGAEKMHLLNNAVNLVICQKTKVDDWIKHLESNYSDMKVFNLTKKSGALSFKNHAESDIDTEDMYVGVINYDLVFRRSYYGHMKGFTLMLDESSLISNEGAARSKYILNMHPESVILLSGTPVAGKYERLWSQCRLLGWNISKEVFWKSYIITSRVDVGGFTREIVTGYKNVSHLKKKLAEYGAIFKKTCEVMDLPDQIEQKISVDNSKEYKEFMKNNYVKFEVQTPILQKMSEIVELIGGNTLTRMLCARQLCGMYSKEKLNAFRDLVESSGDRLIVFYNFDGELNEMLNICREIGRKTSTINGGGADTEAYENVDDSVTFVQYQAGAMGWNLQKANKIIYFTLPLGKGSCDLWEQSKKRIHRIGQGKTCFYYYLLVRGSIEEHNLTALKTGKELTDELFKYIS